MILRRRPSAAGVSRARIRMKLILFAAAARLAHGADFCVPAACRKLAPGDFAPSDSRYDHEKQILMFAQCVRRKVALVVL